MQTSILISKEALIHNIKSIRAHIGPSKKILSIVKANAYGHGVSCVTPLLEDYIDIFAIDDVQELVELRTITKKDIYVLGHVCHEDIETCLRNNGIMVVYDKKTIKMIDQIAIRLKITAILNIKIDALLGRQGVLLEDLSELLEALKVSKNIQLRGIYSHFANSENDKDFSHSQKQIDILKKAIEMAKNYGFTDIETHISSTAGSLIYEKENNGFSHVRIGIGLYGLWPSEKVKTAIEGKMQLQPVLSWKTRVSQVKKVPAGFPIGYEGTYVTKTPMKIAVIPVGYSDGYDRGLSNKGEVLIGGTRCSVLGRIAMNMFVVDVSEAGDVQVDDEVVLIGSQGLVNISADEIANHCDTISYEVVARISPLLSRSIV